MVWEAATTDQPRLRWIAGVDAEALLRNRSAADDDEYVARDPDPDLEHWRQYWSALAELEL